MMAEYVAAKGLRIQLTEILDAANKRITDLPTIPAYVANGRPFVCWAHILGRCIFLNCQFKNGHVPRSAIPDSFADEVVVMLTPGVRQCVDAGKNLGGSPKNGRRPKGRPDTAFRALQNGCEGTRDCRENIFVVTQVVQRGLHARGTPIHQKEREVPVGK